MNNIEKDCDVMLALRNLVFAIEYIDDCEGGEDYKNNLTRCNSYRTALKIVRDVYFNKENN